MDKKSLIAQISQNLKPAPVVAAGPPEIKTPVSSEVPPKAVSKPQPRKKRVPKEVPHIEKTTAASESGATGKQIAFWFDDDDRAILQEMGMLLYTQGIKPSHNLVVRAALRMMPKDHRFFEKAQELLQKDGRKLRHLKGD